MTSRIILASKSPRRKQLLREIGLDVEIKALDVDETIPDGMSPEEAVRYLADKKASAVQTHYNINDAYIIGSDTIVVHNNEILGKPAHQKAARAYINRLSGNKHSVITGVAIKFGSNESYVFSDTAIVSMATISEDEITYYIDHGQPFDKAGAYGIQEWIGWAKITQIQGTFATIIGLPVHMVYQYLHTVGAITI